MRSCGSEGRSCYTRVVDQEQFRLSLFTAEFIRPETETAFQQEKWAERSRQNKVVAWLWTAAVLGIWIWTGLRQPDLWGTWSLASNLFAGLCILLASRPKKFYVHYDLVFCLILLLLLISMTVVVVEGKPGNSLWVPLFVTVPLLTNIALNLRSLYTWIVTVLGLEVFFRMLVAQDLDPEFIDMLMIQMLIASGVGVVIHRLISASRRLEFSKLATEKILNESLSKAKREAERANRAKSDFLASMSHELRTPMNGVLGLSSLLEKTELAADQEKWVQGIRLSASSLMSLLDDLLDLSKIEAGKLQLRQQAFSLEQVIGESVRLIQPMAENKGLDFSFEVVMKEHSAFLGDPLRIRQVLINLLVNAVKFTDRGKIHLGVRVEPGEGSQSLVYMVIEDTGKGIPEGIREKIYDKFFQGDEEQNKGQGSGLGLAIVRELVDQMRGSLEMKGREGGGTLFRLVWEWEEAFLPVSEKAFSQTIFPQWENKTILLAEDNRINALVAVESLKSAGVGNVVVASDGLELIRLAAERSYDLILMDLAMPHLDGLQAMARLRGEPGPNKLTPVVAMTAYVDEGHRERCRNSGMSGFLGKPFQEQELVEILHTHFQSGNSGFSAFDLQAWDGAEALRRMGNNKAALQQALKMAEEDFPDYLRKLRAALDRRDTGTAQKLIHTYKGACSVLGADVLVHCADHMQRVLSAGASTEIETVLRSLENRQGQWLKEMAVDRKS